MNRASRVTGEEAAVLLQGLAPRMEALLPQFTSVRLTLSPEGKASELLLRLPCAWVSRWHSVRCVLDTIRTSIPYEACLSTFHGVVSMKSLGGTHTHSMCEQSCLICMQLQLAQVLSAFSRTQTVGPSFLRAARSRVSRLLAAGEFQQPFEVAMILSALVKMRVSGSLSLPAQLMLRKRNSICTYPPLFLNSFMREPAVKSTRLHSFTWKQLPFSQSEFLRRSAIVTCHYWLLGTGAACRSWSSTGAGRARAAPTAEDAFPCA